MATYNVNSPDAIREVFSLEGDALQRAGFSEPDMSEAPEGFCVEQVAMKPAGTIAMKAATKKATANI